MKCAGTCRSILHVSGVTLKQNCITPYGDGAWCGAFNRIGKRSAGTNSGLSSRLEINNSRCSW